MKRSTYIASYIASWSLILALAASAVLGLFWIEKARSGEFMAVAYDQNGFELAGANGYSEIEAEDALSFNLVGLTPARIKIWKVVKENAR